jgi:two-component system chemotaxis response regulator CheY
MALNVLVVDDSAVTRAMIIKTMEMAGLSLGEIYQAGDGQEGLDQLSQNWVDLALVDINMPVMNGEEMIENLRANPELKNLPVIVVSTEGSQTRIERLMQKGVKFIHKPFAPETVREVIAEITGISHGPQESETDF